MTATAAPAAVSKCQAENLATGAKESPDLQRLIDSADPGQTLQVKGVCVGNYTIGKDLTLVGKPTKKVPSPTLQAALPNGSGRPLHVTTGDVTLEGLTITGGSIDAHGGGIRNDGDLTLINSHIVANHAISKREGGVAVGGIGGGIYSAGPLTLISSTVTDNTGDWSGGGVFAFGPTLKVHDSSISNNQTPSSGGGIYVERTVTLLSGTTTVDGNSAGRYGGGIFGTGVVTITDDATVSNNRASIGGGVFTVLGWSLTLSGNATITGNTSERDGAGIHLTEGARLTMTDAATVTGNRADSDGDGDGAGGGLYTCRPGTLTGVTAGDNITLNYRGTDDTTVDDVTNC